MKRIHGSLTAAMLALGLMQSLPAHAEDAAERTVDRFYAQLLGTMKQGQQLGFEGRKAKLTPAVQASFDMPEMAKDSVGSSWASATPQERADLVHAFTEFSVASYAARFSDYNGQSFTITGEQTVPNNGGVIVQTTMQQKDGDPVAFNYLLHQDGGGAYKIVDVFVDGTISEIATKRSEFSSVARSGGIPALTQSLDAKSKELGSAS